MEDEEPVVVKEDGRARNWVPHDGTNKPMWHLADQSEASAWRRLMHSLSNPKFLSRSYLEAIGYTVRNMEGAQ